MRLSAGLLMLLLAVATAVILLTDSSTSVEAASLLSLPGPEPCYSATRAAGPAPSDFLHWGPDGSGLVLKRGSRIHSVKADGSGTRLIASTANPVSYLEWPSYYTGMSREEYLERMKYTLKVQEDQNKSQDRLFLGRPYADLSPDGSTVIYSTCAYHLSEIEARSLDGTLAKRITHNHRSNTFPAWGPASTRIAFVTGPMVGDPRRLIVIQLPPSIEEYNPKTEEAQAISPESMNVISAPPRWSPDGRRIAFVAEIRDPESEYYSSYDNRRYYLHTVDSEGGELRLLSEASSLPAWSPDGKRIALVDSHADGLALYTMASDGSDKRLVAQVSGDSYWARPPSWSHDGAQILFYTGQKVAAWKSPEEDLAVVNADGTGLGVVYQYESSTFIKASAWSPDSSRIAIVSQEGTGRRSIEVFTVLPDGSGRETLARSARSRSLIPEKSLQADIAGSASRCSQEGTISNPEETPGLVRDCETLLTLLDALGGKNLAEGNPLVNWYPGINIESWDGVEIGGSPPRIQELSLPSLWLGGAIPRQIGNLTNLTKLDLSNNRLGGVIPPELGNLKNLRTLNLSDNQLVGYIPPQLGNLPQLEELKLGSNYLTGRIPGELGNLERLEILRLPENALRGNIPADLYRLASLKVLDLMDNRFTGNIPEDLGQLNNLVALGLSGNSISGCLPWPAEAELYIDSEVERCSASETPPSPNQ